MPDSTGGAGLVEIIPAEPRTRWLHKAYTPHWLAQTTTWVVFELLFPLIPAWAWVTLYSYGITVEAVAIRRSGKGDSLSEHGWVFGSGGRDRDWILTGFALALFTRFFSLRWILSGEIHDPTWPMAFLRTAPLAFLCGSAALWFVFHLRNRGAHG